jgi:hypothetical protein
MLETKIRLKVGNLSDIGKVRESNQDYYGKYEGQFGTLYIVCDGMGGHAGGDKASRLAVDKIRESFFQLTSPLTRPLGEIMADSIVYAHNQIMDYASRHPDKTGMGTTVVMLLIQGDTWWIAHVGDSRIYMKRKGKITQLTKDHICNPLSQRDLIRTINSTWRGHVGIWAWQRCRCRQVSKGSLDLGEGQGRTIAQGDTVSFADLGYGFSVAVHKGSVGRAKVFNLIHAIYPGDLGMPARNRRVTFDYVAV